VSESLSTEIGAELEREAQAKRLRENRRATEREDLIWLMERAQGRRVLWSILEDAGLLRSSFAGTTNETFFREGERNVALKLQAKLRLADEAKFSEVLQEQFKRD